MQKEEEEEKASQKFDNLISQFKMRLNRQTRNARKHEESQSQAVSATVVRQKRNRNLIPSLFNSTLITKDTLERVRKEKFYILLYLHMTEILDCARIPGLVPAGET